MSTATTYKPRGGESLAALLLIVPFTLWSAFVAMKLWAWFLVPAGVPMLGFVHLIGVRLVTIYFSRGVPYADTTYASESDHVMRVFFWPIFAPAYVLGMGWLIKVWM